MRLALLVLFVLLASGCATSLSGFQPAHVAPKGHVSAELGWDVSVPTGTISRAIDAGKTLANAAKTRSLTDAERRQLIEAGANVAINPPALVMHAGLTYVPITAWELGLRWSPGSWRAGVRHQFLEQASNGVDLTMGLGLARYTFEFPVNDVLGGVIHLDDFSRWNLDVPLVVGKHASWYRLWGGPRLLFSRFDTTLTLNLPAAGGSPAEAVVASVDGSATYLGGQGGFAIGYRYLFVGMELTIVQLISGAHLELGGQRQDVDLGGLVIYPGIALMGEF
jgi:hypothetical protein